MTPITVVIVDDHKVVARSLKTFLESFPDVKVVATASSGEEVLEHLREWRPQVVLQDLLLPGGIDGIQTVRRLLRLDPRVRVVALTASTDEGRMIGVLKAGAAGYVRKNADPEVLLDAVRSVAAGRTYLDPSVTSQVLAAVASPGELTEREMDVLRQLALGRTNKEIAAALSLGDETVKSHVANVLSKLQVENRSQAVVQGLKRGLVTLDWE